MEYYVYLIFTCFLLPVPHVLGCKDINCYASNGTICNQQGDCDCGVCKCTGSYSGPTCEECDTCPPPCDIYKGCVGCKIFGTGPMSTMECIVECESLATYYPVDKSEFDNPRPNEDKILCNNLNKDYCMESFMIGGMADGYRDLYVRTEKDCSVEYLPANPPVIEVPLYNGANEHTGTNNGGHTKSEDVVAVSGTNQGQKHNGAERSGRSGLVLLLVACLTILV